jgi:hypothetical protein
MINSISKEFIRQLLDEINKKDNIEKLNSFLNIYSFRLFLYKLYFVYGLIILLLLFILIILVFIYYK